MLLALVMSVITCLNIIDALLMYVAQCKINFDNYRECRQSMIIFCLILKVSVMFLAGARIASVLLHLYTCRSSELL